MLLYKKAYLLVTYTYTIQLKHSATWHWQMQLHRVPHAVADWQQPEANFLLSSPHYRIHPIVWSCQLATFDTSRVSYEFSRNCILLPIGYKY